MCIRDSISGISLDEAKNYLSKFAGGGEVIGPGTGTSDDINAKLSDGEFVMSRGAVNKYGADTMESMNAMGGGTNRPMVRGGVTYAQGGGFAGSKNRQEKSSKKENMSGRKEESSTNSDGGFLGGIAKALGFGKSKDKKDTEVSSGGGFNESSLKAAMDKAGYTDPTELSLIHI